MNYSSVFVAVEGELDEYVVRRVLDGFQDVTIAACLGKKGKDNLKRETARLNDMARKYLIVELVDLDDANCASELINTWFPNGKRENLIFRVAVRMVESWLLADRESIASFLSIPLNKVPLNPDTIDHPKKLMIDLARKSRSVIVRRNLVPPVGSSRVVGGAYNSEMARFVQQSWNVENAAANSPSLMRALKALNATFG